MATVTSETQLQNHGQTFDLNLSPSDEKWIIDNFPSLKICKSEFGITEITGKLYFLMDQIKYRIHQQSLLKTVHC